jgi:hypothetical protein
MGTFLPLTLRASCYIEADFIDAKLASTILSYMFPRGMETIEFESWASTGM